MKTRSWMLAALAAAAWSCDSPAGTERTDVASLVIAPDPATVTADGNVQLQATALDRLDAPLDGVPVFWSSEDSLVAAVSSDGMVTGRSPGTVRVAASSGGVSALATVIVTPKPVASVSIAPSDTTIVEGEEVSLRVTARDAGGATLTGRPVTWSSSAPAVATVDRDGRVVGVAKGTAEITGTVEGKIGRSTVRVSRKRVARVEVDPPAAALLLGQRMQFEAIGIAADGSELSELEVQWTSSNSNIARVSSSGAVTALAVGAATITATIEDKSATVGVGVGVHPVASLTVSPSTAELFVGDEQQLEAIPKAEDGAVLTGRSTTWSSNSVAVAKVSSSGLVTAVAPGNATITASSEGKSATASVQVERRPVATVEVTPGSLSLTAGSSGSLTAVLRGEDGSTLTGRTISWRSGSPAVATVDGNGLVQAVAPGTTDISATSEGVSGSAAVAVTARPVATVEVSPESLKLLVGESKSLVATLKASDGSKLSGEVRWSSEAEAVATVDANGHVTAVAPGTTNITATSGGVSGRAAVTVTARPVAKIEVSPESLKLLVGASESLVAKLKANDGTELTGEVSWSSDSEDVATVDGNGRVTAIAAGKTTITATSGGIKGKASVTVEDHPVARVEVDPAVLQLFVGEDASLEAITKAADGTVLSGRSVAWASDAEAVATVDATGRVTAVAPGNAKITASSEGHSGQASVTVTLEPVASVEVSPAALSLRVEEVEKLEATVRNAAGEPLDDRKVQWSSNAPNVATVSATGTVKAVSPGLATITGTSDGVSGEASVEVVGPPATLSIVSGDDQSGSNNTPLEDPLVVVVRDGSGRPVKGVRVRWRTDSGYLSPDDTRTAPDGTAQTQWTLGGGIFLLPRYAYAEVEDLPRVRFTALRK